MRPPRPRRTLDGMRIEYVHASRFGNGAAVAEEFRVRMAAAGVTVGVRHVRDARPASLPAADLYVFSSPGRFGKPSRRVRRFLRHLELAPGTRYAVLTTEALPRPDTQRVRPIINEILTAQGLVKVAEDTVHVTGVRGPLEPGWHHMVAEFAERLLPPAPAQRGVLAR